MIESMGLGYLNGILEIYIEASLRMMKDAE